MTAAFSFARQGDVMVLRAGHRIVPFHAWGFELGDWFSMYSSSPGNAYRCQWTRRPTPTGAEYEIALARGRYRVEQCDDVTPERVHREYTLTALADGWLGDFVVRFGLPARVVTQATIGGQTITHTGQNVYHQYRVAEAAFALGDPAAGLTTRVTQHRAAASWELWTYVRDEPPDRWICHHRFLSAEQRLSMWRIWRWEFAMPAALACRPPVRAAAEHFHLYRERLGRRARVPIQVAYLSPVRAGEQLAMRIDVSLQAQPAGPA
jgi:hypothetical protein